VKATAVANDTAAKAERAVWWNARGRRAVLALAAEIMVDLLLERGIRSSAVADDQGPVGR
jgi:hypothetical protein